MQPRDDTKPQAEPDAHIVTPTVRPAPAPGPSQSVYPIPSPAHPAVSDIPPSVEKDDHEGWRSVLSTVALFLIAPIIALSIAAFIIQSYQVDGQSMETTLQNHDRLIVDKAPRTFSRITHRTYIPNRGDIIIFNQSGLPGFGSSGTKQLIKRVVGLPGERVTVNNGKVTVYNAAHPEGFDPDTATTYKITAKYTPGTLDVSIPQKSIYVLGDNRTNSEDSRYFGPVKAEDIVGKLMLRLLPIDKVQKF